MNEALLGPRGSEAQKTQEGQGGERQLHCGDEKRRPRGGAKSDRPKRSHLTA